MANMETVVCKETYGPGCKRYYVQKYDNYLTTVDQSEKLTSVAEFFRSVFLPQGYPSSVSTDYLQYQIWDTVQAFASSITGGLATQAVLKGVGVGDENASVLAATMTWIIKDGTGMMGRILFAWFKGLQLDADCKRWRLFADILNDCAICLEIIAPVFEGYFRVIVCVAGLFKSIVGVAGGATRAALTQHQARRDNMADVSAKDGSQETLVNLAALICNLILMPLVTGKTWLIWTLFLLFTSLHLFANFRAVTCVTMETFNQTRLFILAQYYLQSGPERRVMSIPAANAREPVLWKIRRKFKVILGCQFVQVMQGHGDVKNLCDTFQGAKYLLSADLKKGIIYVVLHNNSSVTDQLEACYHADVIEHFTKQSAISHLKNTQQFDQQIIQTLHNGDINKFVTLTRTYVRQTFSAFVRDVQSAGWDTTKALLCADEWRSEWDPQGLLDKKAY